MLLVVVVVCYVLYGIGIVVAGLMSLLLFVVVKCDCCCLPSCVAAV